MLRFLEVIYINYTRLSKNKVKLVPHMYQSISNELTISQDPNNPKAKIVSLSNNELGGIEFTYTFYLYIDPSSFNNSNNSNNPTDGLLHIFHKGYKSQYPLLAPGVYMHSTTNTLRVYMNTYKTWNNYIDVENIPVMKWVHITILCKEYALEIYINGNIAKKLSFEGYVPYQNFQDITVFSARNISKTNIPSADAGGFHVYGKITGNISTLTYRNYALCYAEIQESVNEGPSTRVDSKALSEVPPYLTDTWWANTADN
jgi:hypothetical protein